MIHCTSISQIQSPSNKYVGYVLSISPLPSIIYHSISHHRPPSWFNIFSFSQALHIIHVFLQSVIDGLISLTHPSHLWCSTTMCSRSYSSQSLHCFSQFSHQLVDCLTTPSCRIHNFSYLLSDNKFF